MKKIFCSLLFFVVLTSYSWAIKITITDPTIRPFKLYIHPYNGKVKLYELIPQTFKSLPNFQILEEPRSVDFDLKAEDDDGGLKITLTNYKTNEFTIFKMASNLSSLYLLLDSIYEKITQTKGIFSTKIVFSMNWYGKREIFISDFYGRGIKKITSNGRDSICPKLSNNRKYIVYTLYEQNGGTSLNLINLSDYTEKKIYASKELLLAGGFSSDDNFIYFTSYDGKQSKIYKFALANNKEQIIYRSSARIASPVPAFQNGIIGFVSDEFGSPSVFLLNLDNRSIRRVTRTHAYATSPSFPREAGYLAYLAQIGGKNQIFITSYDNTDQVQLSYGNISIDDIVWLKNERFMLASKASDKESVLYLVDIPTQKYIKLFDIKANFSYLNAN